MSLYLVLSLSSLFLSVSLFIIMHVLLIAFIFLWLYASYSTLRMCVEIINKKCKKEPIIKQLSKLNTHLMANWVNLRDIFLFSLFFFSLVFPF